MDYEEVIKKIVDIMQGVVQQIDKESEKLKLEEKPEDWTDLKTIQDWRTRLNERYNTERVPISVEINKTFKEALNNNFQPNINKFDGVKIIVKKNTLSDKIMYAFLHSKQNELLIMDNPTEENIDKFVERGFIPVDDVKEKIKDYINSIAKSLNTGSFTQREILERNSIEVFGQRLQ